MKLSPRARLTWCAHLYKACVKRHHRELYPALSQLIESDFVIFDVGSHAGQFTKLFSRLVPNGHVYAFEPGSYALSILRPAIRMNRLENVTLFPCGLGDVSGEVRLSVPIKPSGSIGYGISHIISDDIQLIKEKRIGWGYHEELIKISTIDEMVENQSIDRIDFIKADIEGWELRMLYGAELTLSRHKPTLMIEVDNSHLSRANDNSSILFKYLENFGYHAYK